MNQAHFFRILVHIDRTTGCHRFFTAVITLSPFVARGAGYPHPQGPDSTLDPSHTFRLATNMFILGENNNCLQLSDKLFMLYLTTLSISHLIYRRYLPGETEENHITSVRAVFWPIY
jgi:hypothetical protein